MSKLTKNTLSLIRFKLAFLSVGYLVLIALCAKLALQTSQMKNQQIIYSYLAVVIIFGCLSLIQFMSHKKQNA